MMFIHFMKSDFTVKLRLHIRERVACQSCLDDYSWKRERKTKMRGSPSCCLRALFSSWSVLICSLNCITRRGSASSNENRSSLSGRSSTSKLSPSVPLASSREEDFFFVPFWKANQRQHNLVNTQCHRKAFVQIWWDISPKILDLHLMNAPI